MFPLLSSAAGSTQSSCTSTVATSDPSATIRSSKFGSDEQYLVFPKFRVFDFASRVKLQCSFPFYNVCVCAYLCIHTYINLFLRVCVYTRVVASFPPSSILILVSVMTTENWCSWYLSRHRGPAGFCTMSPLKPKSQGGYLSHRSENRAAMPVWLGKFTTPCHGAQFPRESPVAVRASWMPCSASSRSSTHIYGVWAKIFIHKAAALAFHCQRGC